MRGELMETVKNRFITLLLVFVMIFTSLPINALAATPSEGKTEITNIKEQNGKQIVELARLRGDRRSFNFRNGTGFFSTGAETTDETIEQKVTITLETLGLNFGENTFDSSALDEALPFDVTIKFQDPVNPSIAQSERVTFNKGETTKNVSLFIPKRLGQAKITAELTALDANINLRVYKSGDSTPGTIGQDLSFDFMISQIVHPIIKEKVTDPYGKELNDSIAQVLAFKLKLGQDEYTFDLGASQKHLNIRMLDTFKDDPFPLNLAGDSQSLELTTNLDANKRITVDGKTYKLNKITYNALGQEVEINGVKQKVGGYIEFATQPKIIVPTPDENGDLPTTPDGYKRLSFHAESDPNAQDGRFEDGGKLKVIDVLEGTQFNDKGLLADIAKVKQPYPLLNGRKDDNKKFLKWNPALPTNETTGKVVDADYWAVYLKDGGEITPGEKLPDGVFEVKVIKDDTIAKDALYGKSYGVFQGSTLARDKFPDLEAAKGHQNPKWTTEAEAPETGMVDVKKPWTKEIHKATTFKATASKLPDIIENPTKPTPEGYVRVTFKAGEGVKAFENAKTYDVKEGTALTQEQYPTAKAKVGYKDPTWDVVPGTAITSANNTITATATKIEDIVPGGPGVDKPEGYYVVEFLEGKHGEFKPVNEKPQVTVYYVNPEAKVKMSQITAPTVTAKTGYVFDSWSKEYQAEVIITGDRQITAVYRYVAGVSTEPKEGWTKVTLKSGENGQFTKTTNVEGGQPKTEEFDDLVYYVDPEREVTIPAPVVKASVGYTFTGFKIPLTGTFKTETTINAKYLATSDVIEDKTPGDDTEKPEGYVTVKFEAGQNGTFAANSVTKYFVNPEKEVEIGAPGVEPNKNFVFKGFFNGEEEHSSAKKKYAKDVTYTAKYEDKSNESIIPGDQQKPGGWVTISFSAGEHGTFELVNGKQPTIAYHVNPEKEVVLKEKAPTVKDNDGYKFTKYDPDVETARKYTTEGQVITAQYKATVVTEDPNDTDYAKLTFIAGENGQFGQNAKTEIWVLKNEDVKFNAPKVNANEGFVFNGWNPELQTKYTEDKIHTAKYEPKSNISDTKVDGFQEVKFVAGDDGHFGYDVKEKSVWVRPDTLVDLRPNAPTVTVTAANKSFIGWDKDLVNTFAKSDQPTVINAKYDDTVKTTEPTGKDKEKYAKVDFVAGNLGTIEGNQQTTFWVVKGEKVTAAFKEPTVKAVENWKQKASKAAWSPEVADKYDNDTIHVAQYEFKGDGLVPQKTGEPKPNVPENFVKIEFKRGANGVISSEETFIYWADPAKGYTLKAPAVIADKGYKHTGWSPEIQANHKYTEKTEFTAQYKANVVTEDPNDTTNYAKISFTTDGNGSLEGTKEFWVLKGEKVSFNAPKVTANENYKFKAWDKPLQETYNEDTTHKATFESTLNVSDTEVKGYYKVTFKAGDHGTLTEKSVWIKPNTLVDLTDKAPEVTANTGYSHIGWKPGLVGTFSKDTDLVAQYTNSASDTYVDGWIEITFDQGDHGKLETNAKNVKWVDPKADIKLGDIAPRLKADPNWTFKTWNDGTENGNVDLTTAKKYVKPVAYKAHYEATVLPKDDYDKLTEDEKKNFVQITFDKGENGKFPKEAVTEVYVKKDVAVDLTEKAPTVIPNQGYGHSGWEPSLKGTFSIATTIKAQYKEGTFDENAIKEIIVLGPTKMGYGVGEKLDLTGLKVIAKDDAGLQKTYNGLDAIKAAGFTIDPKNETVLAMSDNGKYIVVTKGEGNDKVTGKTETTLTIHENKSAKAEDVKALNQNVVGPDGKPTDQPKDTTTITGKAPAGSTVIVKNEAGDQIGKVDKVGNDGTFTAEVTKQDDGKKVQVIVTEKDKAPADPAEATVATDANNDGTADKDADQKTKTPTAKALNQGEKPVATTITGKAEPGAKVVAKVGEEVVGDATADNKGEYKIEAKQNEQPLAKDTEVKVTAQADKKLISDATATIVRIDKDSNGTADNEEDFNIAKAAKIEVLSDPDKMDYLVSSKEGAVKFEAKGLLVKVTDTAGNYKVYNAEDLANDPSNFKVEPANGANMTIADNNGKTVKVTLNTAPEGMDPKFAETAKKLSIKVDADGNGVADDKEKFDIKKATKVEIIKNPDKMDYLVKTADEKAKFETKGLIIRLTDDSGKTVTYKAEDLEKDGVKDKITLSPVKDAELGLSDNNKEFTVTVNGADKTPSVTADKKITVKLDADGNGSADETETTPAPKVTARNIGENPTKTTVDVKTEPNAKVTIEYTDKNGQPQKIEITADGDGKVSKEIDPKLDAGAEVTVTVKDGEKKPATKNANVFNDLDGNGVNNEDEKTPMPSILSAKNVKDGEDVKTTVKVKGVKGATITIKSEDGTKELGKGTIGESGEVEIKLDPKQEAGTRVKAIAKLGERKDSEPAESIVFDDLDGDNKPDGQGKIDLDKIVQMRIASDSKNMKYALKSDSDTADLKLDGLTVYVKDENGNSAIYQYGAAANKVNEITFEELKGNANFKLELVDGSGANSVDITDQTKLGKANDANKIKVSLVKKPDQTDKTGPLNVFVDANGNGIDDSKEKIDLTKVNKIEVISQPELNYPITEKDSKTKLDITKMVVAVSDGVTTANYKASELLASDKFKLSLVDSQDAEQAEITQTNMPALTIANDGNKVKVELVAKPDVNAKTDTIRVFVHHDKDIIPVKPGEEGTTTTPEGYVRVTLTKDDKSVDFAQGVATSYDVKADGSLLYSQVVANVGATAKQGYKDLKWYKENNEVSLLDKVTGTEAITLNAKAENANSIIPVKPGESTPEGYVRITLKHDETVTFKDSVETSYDVKADGSVVYSQVIAKVDAKPVEGYRDLTWSESNRTITGNEAVIGTKAVTLNATASHADSIIEVKPEDKDKPVPAGFVRVTLVNDKTSVKDFNKYYDVKTDAKVKYGDVILRAGEPEPAENYKTPITWKMNNQEIDKLVVIADESILTAYAEMTTAIDPNRIVPEAQDQTVKQGEEPKAEDSIANKDKLPEGTKYEFVDPITGGPTKPDTNTPGDKEVKIKVTYPDGSSEIVGPTKIIVGEKKPLKPIVEPIKEGDNKVVVIPPRDGDKVKVTLPDGTTVEATKDPTSDTWRTPDINPDGTPKTGPSGEPMTKEVTMTEDGKLEIPVDPEKVKPGEVTVVVEDTKTITKSEPAVVKVQELERIIVGVDSIGVGTNRLFIRTSVDLVTVDVKIGGKLYKTITTDGFGEYNLTLGDAIKSRQAVELLASKEGYNPGRYFKFVH